MEKTSKIFYLTSIALLSIFLFSKVFSYSPHYTHPDLTEQMAKLFNNINKNSERAVTGEEIQWMRQGAIDEDEPARWINHFYNPINGQGWTGSRFGYLTPEQGLATVADIAAREPIPSIDWVTNQDYQSAYGRQFGNQTWQKAIKAFADGDKKSAFIALGHIMHLVEDATVPEHTRDDTHADLYGDPGSPYEKYSADFTNFNKLTFADDLKNSQFLNFSNIKDVIFGLAIYSNNNFFTADTINDPAYKLPDISKFNTVLREVDGKEYRFVYNREENIYLAKERSTGVYTINEKQYVLPSYASHLMPKAVQYGASAMNLFFNEVDRYKNSGEKITITQDTNVPFKQALIAAPKLAGLGVVDTLGQAKSDILIALNNSLSILPVSLASGLRSKLGLAAQSANTQSNTELENQPMTQNPPPEEPANPTVIAGAVQTPKPRAPALKPTPPQVIAETPAPPIPQPMAEPPAQPIILTVPAQPKPSYIIAIGYVPPAPPAPPAEENQAVLTDAPTITSSPEVSTSTPTSTLEIATTTISTTSTEEVVTSTFSTTTTEDSASTTVDTATTTIDVVTTTLDTATTTSSTIATDPAPLEVVINEVAWAGTASSRADDEWFELYNNTDQEIDLTDWKIFVSGTRVNLTKVNNKNIAARGYYLLERKEDSVVRDIGADAIYSLSGGFNNKKGEKLELFKPNDVKVDEVDASGGWFAGTTSIKYRSMERLDATKNGSDPTNWQSNQGSRPTGQNTMWLPVYGSPRQSNFGYLVLESLQEESVRTLDMKNSPYVVWSYTVPVGKTLNIDPDVNILLQLGGTMEVNGSLNALGTQDKPVNFLPYVSSTSWANLRFNNSTSTFNFVNFRRGDRITRLFQNLDGMILAKNSNLTISSSLIWDSEANAIGGTDSIFNISNTTIGATVKNNKTYGINVRGGILNLDNVSFSNLYVGVEAGGSVDPHPELHKNNTPDTNFTDVAYIAEPLTWWNAVSSTSP
ncbi:MAG: lamin tail domain-containing protein [Patescibacteria group bacterium]